MRRLVLWILGILLAIILLPPRVTPLLGLGPDMSRLPPPGKGVVLEDGNELSVFDHGSGPAVVLVHGLPSCASDWKDTPAKLIERGYRVIAYDRVGYGFSSRAPNSADRYTYKSNARDLLELLDKLHIDQAALVGWSYGGAVVQTLAEQAPKRVSHLVLLAAVGPAQPQDDKDPLDTILASPFASGILQWFGSIPPLSRSLTDNSLTSAFTRADDVPAGWREYTQAMLALPGTLDAFVWEAQRGDESTLHPEKLKLPTLVLHGTEDRLVPLSVGEDLHRRIAQSQIVSVPRGSHMLPVTHPDLVADAIDKFLKQG